VKLIDVIRRAIQKSKDAGYELMIADEILRGSFATHFQSLNLSPQQVIEYAIDLHTNDHASFRPPNYGCRSRVPGSRSNDDRNPQKFVPNIFLAREFGLHGRASGFFRRAIILHTSAFRC